MTTKSNLNGFWRFMSAIGIRYNIDGIRLNPKSEWYPAFNDAWKGERFPVMRSGDVRGAPKWRGGTYTTGEPKPVFRGVLHLASAIVLMPLLFYFGSQAWHSSVSMSMVLLVDIIVTLLLLISGLYHRVPWPTERSNNFFRRWDHCNIFLFNGAAISAQAIYLTQQTSSTIVAMGVTILAIEWFIVAIGVGYSCGAPLFSGIDQRRIILYVLSGIIPFCFVGVFYYIESGLEFAVQIIMLVLSFLCVLMFERHILDVAPDIFGSHEIFHIAALIGMSITCWLAYSLALKV